MKRSPNMEKPTINIYYDDNFVDTSMFLELLWGIEEEGIPYSLHSQNNETSIELGYRGAEESRLDVGIGIGKDKKIILHYTKLEKERPLFTIDISSDKYVLRALGSNAARLVKGIPFKEMNPKKSEKELNNIKNNENIDIAEIVAKVLERLK